MAWGTATGPSGNCTLAKLRWRTLSYLWWPAATVTTSNTNSSISARAARTRTCDWVQIHLNLAVLLLISNWPTAVFSFIHHDSSQDWTSLQVTGHTEVRLCSLHRTAGFTDALQASRSHTFCQLREGELRGCATGASWTKPRGGVAETQRRLCRQDQTQPIVSAQPEATRNLSKFWNTSVS